MKSIIVSNGLVLSAPSCRWNFVTISVVTW